MQGKTSKQQELPGPHKNPTERKRSVLLLTEMKARKAVNPVGYEVIRLKIPQAFDTCLQRTHFQHISAVCLSMATQGKEFYAVSFKVDASMR